MAKITDEEMIQAYNLLIDGCKGKLACEYCKLKDKCREMCFKSYCFSYMDKIDLTQHE